MSKKVWVDDDHYRIVSDDGRESHLYKSVDIFGVLDPCIEVAEHHEDGTTDAYEPGILFAKGRQKND